MAIALGEVAAKLIEAKLSAGEYRNADELVVDALRALDERNARRESALAELNASLNEAAASLDRGEGFSAEEVFAEIRAMSRSRKESRS